MFYESPQVLFVIFSGYIFPFCILIFSFSRSNTVKRWCMSLCVVAYKMPVLDISDTACQQETVCRSVSLQLSHSHTHKCHPTVRLVSCVVVYGTSV